MEAVAKSVRFEALPLHHFTVPAYPVKSLTSMGGLKRDEIYYVILITDTGKIMLHGMPERTYPMNVFSRPKPDKDNIAAVTKLLASKVWTDE